jgi:hypothetical protein
MSNFLSVSVKFYQTNGLVGLSLKTISRFRGGDNNPSRFEHSIKSSETSSNFPYSVENKSIEDILAEDQISDDLKKPFRKIRETAFPSASEALKQERLIESLKEKTKHPVYSKIKGKIPYILFIPFSLAELNRLAAFRLIGLVSAPITLPALIGFSMPCAVTFSMLEMYVPDRFKFPCKCAKWTGGFMFYGVCAAVDFTTAGPEKKFFGSELPIDAPQLMGTLPSENDLDALRKLKDSIIQKSLLSEG